MSEMTEMNTLGRLLDQVLDERLRFSRYTATRLCILFFFINPQILCNYCNRVTRFLCSCITYPGYDTSGSYQLRYNTSKGYQLGYTTSGGYHLGYNTSGGLSPRIQYIRVLSPTLDTTQPGVINSDTTHLGVITYPGYNSFGGYNLGYNTSGVITSDTIHPGVITSDTVMLLKKNHLSLNPQLQNMKQRCQRTGQTDL